MIGWQCFTCHRLTVSFISEDVATCNLTKFPSVGFSVRDVDKICAETHFRVYVKITRLLQSRRRFVFSWKTGEGWERKTCECVFAESGGCGLQRQLCHDCKQEERLPVSKPRGRARQPSLSKETFSQKCLTKIICEEPKNIFVSYKRCTEKCYLHAVNVFALSTRGGPNIVLFSHFTFSPRPSHIFRQTLLQTEASESKSSSFLYLKTPWP